MKGKILCVDDDPDLLNINSSILQLAGYKVVSAITGAECLARLKEERPDLVLLDVNLPDISGITICREIKSNPEFFGTYVILISGVRTSSENQIEGFEIGADGYIVRPISGQELIARVHSMMRIKEAEIALKKSKERYQMLIEMMNEGLIVVDENRFITYANNKLCEMIGLSRSEVEGRLVSDFLDDFNKKIFNEQFVKQEENINSPYELTWQHKDGNTVCAIVSPRAIFDKSDNFKGSFAIVTDITERKQMEHILKEKIERLDFAQKAAKIGIFEWHIPTGRISFSKELEHLHSMRPRGFQGDYKSLLETIHPDDRPCVENTWRTMREKREDSDIEFRIITSDRTIRWVSSRCNIFCNQNGEPDRILGINIDITELKKASEEIEKLNKELERRVIDRTSQLRTLIEELEVEILEHKQTEKALKESEEKLRMITFASRDAIILINNEQKILFWNPAAENMFGYSAHEAVGKDFQKLLLLQEYPEVTKSRLEPCRKYWEWASIEETVEFLAIKKDGTKFPVEVLQSLAKVRGKDVTLKIIRDITYHKLDEATIQQYARRLQMLTEHWLEMQKERKSLSAEIDEKIGSYLNVLKVSLEEMKSQGHINITENLNKALSIIENLVGNIKDISLKLYQPMLDKIGLLSALKWYLNQYSRMTNVNVHFKHEGLDIPFPAEVENIAYNFIQDALLNLAKYTTVNEVKILVSAEQNSLVLKIEDDRKSNEQFK